MSAYKRLAQGAARVCVANQTRMLHSLPSIFSRTSVRFGGESTRHYSTSEAPRPRVLIVGTSVSGLALGKN